MECGELRPVWNGATPLELTRIRELEPSPGVLVLLRGSVIRPESVLWVEAVNNVRSRLLDLFDASEPDDQLRAPLHYCIASVADPNACESLADEIRAASFSAYGCRALSCRGGIGSDWPPGSGHERQRGRNGRCTALQWVGSRLPARVQSSRGASAAWRLVPR